MRIGTLKRLTRGLGASSAAAMLTFISEHRRELSYEAMLSSLYPVFAPTLNYGHSTRMRRFRQLRWGFSAGRLLSLCWVKHGAQWFKNNPVSNCCSFVLRVTGWDYLGSRGAGLLTAPLLLSGVFGNNWLTGDTRADPAYYGWMRSLSMMEEAAAVEHVWAAKLVLHKTTAIFHL